MQQSSECLFIYDGDCGFCARFSGWLRNAVGDLLLVLASQHLSDAALEQLGITRAACDRAVQFVDGAVQAEGADAIVAALSMRWPTASTVYRWPLTVLARAIYRCVADRRYVISRFLGGTCGITG